YCHRMDLRPSLEVRSPGLHKNGTQRKIRRAEREVLTYEGGRAEALLRKFYQLLLLTCRRRQLPPQPLKWFRHLIDSAGDSVKIRVASKDGRPVASNVTLTLQHSRVHQYGCSHARFNSL